MKPPVLPRRGQRASMQSLPRMGSGSSRALRQVAHSDSIPTWMCASRMFLRTKKAARHFASLAPFL
eukprot:7830006-Pyramimonas_sp.AAC.1